MPPVCDPLLFPFPPPVGLSFWSDSSQEDERPSHEKTSSAQRLQAEQREQTKKGQQTHKTQDTGGWALSGCPPAGPSAAA